MVYNRTGQTYCKSVGLSKNSFLYRNVYTTWRGLLNKEFERLTAHRVRQTGDAENPEQSRRNL